MMIQTRGPPDGGWGWMCVVGKLFSYFCVLGTASAFGVLYVDIVTYFNTEREEAAWIGSLSYGLTCLSGPLSSVLTSRFGIQKTAAMGTLLAFTGCFISWFANGIPYLYVSYGVMMGIGFGVLFVPSMLIVVQYFDKHLGLANAVGSAGNGLGTVVLPPLYAYLLQQYGWKGTLLILSGIILNGFVCAVIFIPPPYLKSSSEMTNEGDHVSATKSKSFKNFIIFLKRPSFVLYTLGIAIGYFGYPVPFVHLPDMAILNGTDKYRAAYLITIMGVSNVLGRVFFGWLSDFSCVSVIFLQGLSLLMCGIVTAVCPHLTEFYAIAVYCVLQGAFVGTFSSLTSVVPVVLVGAGRTGDALGIIIFLAGVSLTTASPTAGWLFDLTKTYNASFYVASCSFLLSGMMIMVVFVLHQHHVRRNVEREAITAHTTSRPHEDMVQTVSKAQMNENQMVSRSHDTDLTELQSRTDTYHTEDFDHQRKRQYDITYEQTHL